MNGMMTVELWGWSTGKWHTQSATMDFPPQWTHAFITLSKTEGDGIAWASIPRFRYRLPSGTDETVSNNGDTSMAHDQVTSVTAKVETYDAFGYATVVLTYW